MQSLPKLKSEQLAQPGLVLLHEASAAAVEFG
eukprot:COSAG01_NODE_66632_length_269_cov_0.935294_2_plen_31_part_01